MKNFLTIFLLLGFSLTSFGQTINHKFPNQIRYRRVAKKPFNSYDKYYPGFKKVYVRQYPSPYLDRSAVYRPYLGGGGGVIYWGPNYNVVFR